MPEQPMSREQRLANERALYRYQQALERGDIETIAAILQAASHNATLERMIYAMHDLDQPANLSPTSLSPEQHNHHALPPHFPQQYEQEPRENPWPASVEPEQYNHRAEFTSPPRPISRPHSERSKRVRTRLQTLAAVLVMLVLISGSLLLFHALHTTSSTATYTHTPTPTATVATPQGMVVMLFTNGTIQAVRGVTSQRVWSYATGVGGLGDVNLPFYNGLIVQNHVVYALAKDHVFVLNEETGKLIWQKTFAIHLANVTPNNSQIYLDGNTLYVAIQGDTQQVAYALRASDGSQLWQVSSNAYSGTPFLTASNGIAYVAIENTTTFQTTLEARNSSDGHVLWSHQYPGSISFATVAHNVLYVYAFPGAVPPGDSKLDKRLMAFKAETGDLIWSRNVHYGNYTTNIAYTQNTLVVDDNQQLCAHSASNGSRLWCISESTSNPDKNTAIQTRIGSYLASNDRLYVTYTIQKSTPLSPTEIAIYCKQQQKCIAGSQGNMFNTQTNVQVKALDSRSGLPQWTSQMISLNDPVSFSALDLVQLQQNTLLVSSGSPLITALDASNGHQLWRVNGPAQPEILQIVATA